MCCLGRCHENNAFHYNGNNYSGSNIKDLANIISKKEIKKDHYEVAALNHQILTGTRLSINDYASQLKQLLTKSKEELLEQIKLSRRSWIPNWH